MDARTRVCVWIIAVGLANFASYTIGWAAIGGESMNGYVRRDADGAAAQRFYMVSPAGDPFEVSRAAWIYSAVHSITVPLTVGAVLLSMLTLAKDRLMASMRPTIVRGRVMITILAAGLGLGSVAIAAYFAWYMIAQLSGAGDAVVVSGTV